MSTSPLRRPRGQGSRTIVAILVAAALVAGVGACDLRLDQPAPTAPAPGAVEQVRERAVADAVALGAAARAAGQTPDGATAAVKAVLDDVAAFSAAHADALGGPYVSGLASPSASAGPTEVSASVQQVLDGLATSSATARQDAGSTSDAGLARLLASIGAARHELAGRLASAAGLTVPASTATSTPAPSTPAPTGPAAGSPTGLPSATTPASALPRSDASALVLAHDQAGYALEAIAAKSSGDVRTRAATSAATHRAQASALAEAAGLTGTPDDPRRAAYTLPSGLSDPAVLAQLAATLESAVADAYATAVAHSPTGGRDPWLTGLVEASAAARTWGAAPDAFPGMPERAQTAG